MNEQQKDNAALMEVEQARGKKLSTADLAATSEQYAPAETGAKGPSMTGDDGSRPARLLGDDEAEKLKGCWSSIQTGFVDDPRRSVEDADTLVAALMKRLAETFADERAKLEEQWSRGGNVSTEDLRVALRRYRSFFDRLLCLDVPVINLSLK